MLKATLVYSLSWRLRWEIQTNPMDLLKLVANANVSLDHAPHRYTVTEERFPQLTFYSHLTQSGNCRPSERHNN